MDNKPACWYDLLERKTLKFPFELLEKYDNDLYNYIKNDNSLKKRHDFDRCFVEVCFSKSKVKYNIYYDDSQRILFKEFISDKESTKFSETPDEFIEKGSAERYSNLITENEIWFK